MGNFLNVKSNIIGMLDEALPLRSPICCFNTPRLIAPNWNGKIPNADPTFGSSFLAPDGSAAGIISPAEVLSSIVAASALATR